MTYVKMLMGIAKDHLKDGQMMIDYAYKCNYDRNEEGYKFFKESAQERLAHYDKIHAKIENIAKEVERSGKQPCMSLIHWHHIKEEHYEWTCSMRQCLSEMKYNQ